MCPLPSLFARTVHTAKHRLSGWTVFLSLLLLCLPVLASAQEATIVGTVTDPSGAVVPNVAILITNVDTGAVRTLVTNDAGQYVVPGLLIGKYDLKAQASGFEVEEYKGVVLDVNDRIRVDFQMKLGQIRTRFSWNRTPSLSRRTAVNRVPSSAGHRSRSSPQTVGVSTPI